VTRVSTRLTAEEAGSYLVGQAGPRAVVHPHGPAGLAPLLSERRCIQLDPLDAIGENADLVVLARLDGVRAGDLHRHLLPGHAFEHFAKERCLLPARAFPHYRDQAAETPWWRLGDRVERLAAQDPKLVDAVLAEVRRRGPVTARDLDDRGRVEPLDWSGWKGTSSAAAMALEVLWTRCQVVVAGRSARGKLFDVPGRALPAVARKRPPAREPFARWALLERVEAAGLLTTSAGPLWSMLRDVRLGDVPRQLVEEGRLEEVTIEGSARRYLAPAGFRDRRFSDDDGRMRILGPLDPLLWDRELVRTVFGFEYVWEVYKPKHLRRWGWYVCPLLHEGRLVGRFEAHREGGELVVDRVWKEPGRRFDQRAFRAAVRRHEAALGP